MSAFCGEDLMGRRRIHADDRTKWRENKRHQRHQRQGMEPLTSLFPYPGGKAAVASVIWQHLGDVRHYLEVFAGSLAVLLARPHPPRVETVNDLDGHITNVWRALAADQKVVASYADWPVASLDLQARHAVLCSAREALTARLRADPAFYDAQLAGYWIYCRSTWAGTSGFGTTAGQMPQPLLTHTGNGIHAIARRGKLLQLCQALKVRLRYVRVFCGDWQACLTPARLFGVGGPVGILLDPPYTQAHRAHQLYAVPDASAPAVRDWAVAHGDNPKLRIALCGLEGEHTMPSGWTAHHWQARGGLANTKASGRGSGETRAEVVWFSASCLQEGAQLPLPV